MNAQTEATIVTKTQSATTLMDHLVVHVILAFVEMEPLVKVSWIGIIISAVTVNYIVIM